MYKVKEHVVFRKKGELLVVLDTQSGNYYTFNTTAVDIWMNILEKAGTIDDMLVALQEKYADTPDRDQMRSEVESLLQDLTAKGLIKTV